MRKLSTSLKVLYLDLHTCGSSDYGTWVARGVAPPLDAAKAFLRESTSTLEELTFLFTVRDRSQITCEVPCEGWS